MSTRAGIWLVLALVVGVADATGAYAEDKIVTLGTAGVTGVYYPAGGAICRLVNRGRKEHNIRCVVESTGGSINNLEGLRKHDFDMGIVQSDLLYHAYKGDEIFTDVGADTKLMVLFSLHSEPFTVITRADSKINSFDDLKGKRVNTGAAGSGPRATIEELMRYKGWSNKAFKMVNDVKQNDQTAALCGGKIDAMVYAGGHPNGAIQQVTSACATKIVSVTGTAIDTMVKEDPYYTYAIIPGGMYPGNPQEVKTFGMKAMLVASSDLDEDVVYELTKAVFDNLDNFKTLHPVFATLEARRMVEGADVVPMHPGALRYFREKGLVD